MVVGKGSYQSVAKMPYENKNTPAARGGQYRANEVGILEAPINAGNSKLLVRVDHQPVGEAKEILVAHGAKCG